MFHPRPPSFPTLIPTKDLTLEDVPEDSASYTVIERFALTFDPSEDDPYKLGGQPLELLNEDTDLTRLRSRLFLEQRSWNHIGHYPDEERQMQIRRVIRLIRAKL